MITGIYERAYNLSNTQKKIADFTFISLISIYFYYYQYIKFQSFII